MNKKFYFMMVMFWGGLAFYNAGRHDIDVAWFCAALMVFNAVFLADRA